MESSDKSGKYNGSWASSGLWPQSVHKPACEVGQQPLPRPTPNDDLENSEEPQTQIRAEVLKVRCSEQENLFGESSLENLGYRFQLCFAMP